MNHSILRNYYRKASIVLSLADGSRNVIFQVIVDDLTLHRDFLPIRFHPLFLILRVKIKKRKLSMEKEKKKYVKPLLRVAEWDFNEAVCDQNVYVQSPCIHVIGNEGGATHIDHRGTWKDNEITWNDWTK